MGEGSILVGRTLQNGKYLGAKLCEVILVKVDPMTMLMLRVDFPTRTGYQETVMRVPVPEGKLEDAAHFQEIRTKQVS